MGWHIRISYLANIADNKTCLHYPDFERVKSCERFECTFVKRLFLDVRTCEFHGILNVKWAGALKCEVAKGFLHPGSLIKGRF